MPKADIVPSLLRLGSAIVNAGGTTPLQLTVANRGTATAQSVAVTISFVSGATTSRAASLNIGTLLAGASGTVATTLTAPMLTGTYTVLVAATTPDQETSTENNTATTTLGVSSVPTPLPPPPVAGCTHYASPSGGGNGSSPSSPLRVRDFWAVAGPGKTLCLLDGTYTGWGSIVQPTPGLSGTAAAPITVRALNDGKALVDGNWVKSHNPLKLENNHWFVIEGINFRNSWGVGVAITDGSSHNILRRIVAWDASMKINTHVAGVFGSSHDNLLEDFAAFGTGRKVFEMAHGPKNNTCRRCWFRWEGTTMFGSKGASPYYNANGSLFENVLVTRSLESMPQTFRNEDKENHTLFTDGEPLKPYAVLENDSMREAAPAPTNSTILGSIIYAKATDRMPKRIGGGLDPDPSATPMLRSFGASGVTFRDVVVVVSPQNPRFALHPGWMLMGRSDFVTENNTATRITSIRTDAPRFKQTGERGDSFHPTMWTVSGLSAGTSLAAVQSPWQNTSTTGARVCNRIVNGVTTDQPLWPWPMNERIKQATAMAGSQSEPCTFCVGGRLPRTATDVTADLEELLGPIAPQCKSH
jgi:hypothetical protein